MVKTKMSHERRSGILEWMHQQYDAKHLPALQKAAEKAIAAVNKAIRAKYPEHDMVVLRKYRSTRQDSCLRLIDSDTNRVAGIDFRIRHILGDYTDVQIEELDLKNLADMPRDSGCRSSEIFPISPAGLKVVDDYIAIAEKFRDDRRKKFVEYGGFTLACKTVDDFNDVIPLPEDMKKRFMTGGSLIAIDEETIANLKKEFSTKKRAA